MYNDSFETTTTKNNINIDKNYTNNNTKHQINIISNIRKYVGRHRDSFLIHNTKVATQFTAEYTNVLNSNQNYLVWQRMFHYSTLGWVDMMEVNLICIDVSTIIYPIQECHQSFAIILSDMKTTFFYLLFQKQSFQSLDHSYIFVISISIIWNYRPLLFECCVLLCIVCRSVV